MALTPEELLLQVNLLASKTSDNPDMVYKANATLNKGLNPDYFTGQQTKIVNAINKLAEDSKKAIAASVDTMDKLNSILLDVSNMDNAALFDQVKELMKAPTVIEGLHSILTGNNQEQLLGLTAEDIGKFLFISQEEDGDLIAKAIEPLLVLEEGNIVLKADDKNISSIPVTEDEDIENIINGLNQ